MDEETGEGDLSMDALREILQQRQGDQAQEKEDEKALRISSANANLSQQDGVDPTATASDTPVRDYLTEEENLQKVLARRSQDVTIQQDDLFQGHEDMMHETPIDFGDDGVPGAYSAAPGRTYGRVEKGSLTVAQHEQLHDASNRNSMTGRTVEESDHPLDDSEVHTLQPIKIEDDDDSNSTINRKRWIILLVVMVLVLAVAVVVPTVLLLANEEEEDGEMEEDMNPILPVPINIDSTVVPNMTASTRQTIQYDPESYQALAYEWVEKDYDLDTYEPWRRQQRFALGCLYFGMEAFHNYYDNLQNTEQPFAKFRPWGKYVTHECRWTALAYETVCDPDGRLKVLDLTGLISPFGFVPPEVAMLSSLETIDLSKSRVKTDLESLFPLNLTQALPLLTGLNLSDSALPGTIPSSIGDWSSLTHLDLNQNDLTSTIPSQLGLLSQLTHLGLAENDLSGTLPVELGDLPLLTEFDVDNNPRMMTEEPYIPEGFCEEDHVPMEHLSTGWCSSTSECCEAL